ncbi:MAG: diacylglycerol kinase [Planctomycetota bacterium]
MSQPTKPPKPDFLPKTWLGKFACAFRGAWVGARRYGLSSFAVHLPVMAAVVALAAWRGVPRVEWLMLILAITVVLAAELCNSAIEALSRAVTTDYDPRVRDALDIASGVVLVMSTGAAMVGMVVLFT